MGLNKKKYLCDHIKAIIPCYVLARFHSAIKNEARIV